MKTCMLIKKCIYVVKKHTIYLFVTFKKLTQDILYKIINMNSNKMSNIFLKEKLTYHI